MTCSRSVHRCETLGQNMRCAACGVSFVDNPTIRLRFVGRSLFCATTGACARRVYTLGHSYCDYSLCRVCKVPT